MFAGKIRVEYEDHGHRLPCPLKWLDSFSMRNFTNASVFDDTLPVGDGRMEIGKNVPLEQLRDAMEDWFRRKSYLPKDSSCYWKKSEDPPKVSAGDVVLWRSLFPGFQNGKNLSVSEPSRAGGVARHVIFG